MKDKIINFIKNNIETLKRGGFILLFGVLLYLIAYGFIWLLTLFQFFVTLFTGKPNQYLLTFSDTLSQYITQIINYMLFTSDKLPFPFSPWPKAKLAPKKATKK